MDKGEEMLFAIVLDLLLLMCVNYCQIIIYRNLKKILYLWKQLSFINIEKSNNF